jgi:O-antigen/teichoic acid export membrane protein
MEPGTTIRATSVPPPGRARVRRIGLGLTDQLVIAIANAANPVLAAALLDYASAGAMLLALSLAYFAMGLSRAFVGEVLVAQAPRLGADERRRLVRNGAAAAASLGAIGAVVLLAVWALWPRIGPARIDLGQLIWVVPALPAVLVQDAGRYAALAAFRPGRALVIDLTWVLTQAAVIVAVLVVANPTGGELLAAWGLGAAAGAVVWLVRDRVNLLRGHPRAWLIETRHLSGWFTGTALVGQIQVQVVAFGVAGALSPAAYVDLRLAQVAILQPVQNLVTASMGLLVPRSSRLAGAGDAAAIRHQTNRVALALAGLAALVVPIAALVAEPVLKRLLPAHLAVASIALPIGLQAGIYLLQIPFTAAIRGMHRGRMLFAQYVSFSTASIAGLMLGAYTAGLRGAAWGLTAGAAVGLAVMIALYRKALADLATTHAPKGDTPPAEPDPDPALG